MYLFDKCTMKLHRMSDEVDKQYTGSLPKGPKKNPFSLVVTLIGNSVQERGTVFEQCRHGTVTCPATGQQGRLAYTVCERRARWHLVRVLVNNCVDKG
jgi:hypothetical protein